MYLTRLDIQKIYREIISNLYFYKLFCFLEPKIKHFWLMGSIWPITVIVVSYLYFVLKIGPEFMRYRNPLNIDRIVMVYNAVQVIFSIYLLKEVRINFN